MFSKSKYQEKFKPFDKKIWLATPTMHGPEMDYMKKAYDTNWMSTVGENINVIEKLIADKVGVKYGVALSSGTAAIHMAVKLAGVKPGDKVFCSDMTFSATVNPIVYESGVPIFIDSEYETWNMDPDALEHAFELYPEVKVVVMAHLYGTPGKIDRIREICDKHSAILIEDAAESLGATYNGIQTGAFGDYGCISFNGNKIITGSSGGMFLTNDAEVANRVKKWSTQSREPANWYQHEEVGYNYRMSNVVAGVVRGQFDYLSDHIEAKKKIYENYEEGFKGIPISMNPYDEETHNPNYWLSCVLIERDAMCFQNREGNDATYKACNGKSCPTEILEVLEFYNIEGRPIWKPMHLQPLYGNNIFVTKKGQDTNTCVSTDIFNRGLCLPSDIQMTKEEQKRIIEIINSCFE